MSVEVVYQCDGCDATTQATLRSRFVSFSGRDSGFGSVVEDKASGVAPEDWVAFDPYTFCTYCPACWLGITAEAEHASC